ncbi:pyridoxal phosphate-dependent transferase [Xylariaceae sp. FL0255]|nr:pyridoxal phosphate-dependent transferase [Xylariaceae sp. FL0255]
MATNAKQSTWVGAAGSAAYDFRSDVVTTPTVSMLAAITFCSLQDDAFREDDTTKELESHCAGLCGKEDAVFVLSRTMGNQVALRSLLTQPPHSILCDHRSHIVNSEAGGLAILTSAMVTPVVPRNGLYLTLEDVQESFNPGGSLIGCPTRVISLENTLNGVIMPLEEVRKIAGFAQDHGAKMHCDGARLWEAVAAGAGSLTELTSCFDTVSLCFSKGLGAPVGSILVGDTDAIRVARHIKKAIGGVLRQPGLITAAARVAVDETFGKGPNGGTTKYPVDTNVVWINLKEVGISFARFNEIAHEEGLKTRGERLIVHYQIWQNADDSLARLKRVFDRAWAERGMSNMPSANEANASVY